MNDDFNSKLLGIIERHKGRILTHKEVGEQSRWSPNELDNVHRGDDEIAVGELISLIKSDVIGNTEVNTDKHARNSDMRREGRNQLRAEQRAILDGGKKK